MAERIPALRFLKHDQSEFPLPFLIEKICFLNSRLKKGKEKLLKLNYL